MQKIRVYLSVVLLGMFVMPQLSNVLHYVVVKHEFKAELNSCQPQWQTKAQTHYCDSFLFKVPALILAPICNLGTQNLEVICRSSSQLRQQLFFWNYFIGYYLRGPPDSLELIQNLKMK